MYIFLSTIQSFNLITSYIKFKDKEGLFLNLKEMFWTKTFELKSIHPFTDN